MPKIGRDAEVNTGRSALMGLPACARKRRQRLICPPPAQANTGDGPTRVRFDNVLVLYFVVVQLIGLGAGVLLGFVWHTGPQSLGCWVRTAGQ